MLQNLRFFFRIHRKQLRTAGIFFLLGLAYYIVTQLTPLRIPCLFQKITGLACPGCGISHFCIRLLHLDFLGAARENLAIALLSPLWLAAFLVRVLWNPKWFAKGGKGENLLLWGSVVVLLLFGVVRNLPHMCNSTPFSLREYNKTVSIIFENHGHTKSVITQNHSSLCFLRRYCTRPVRHCLDR